jgi:hypothetical protein
MLDTNLFNRLLDCPALDSRLGEYVLVATHVQKRELMANGTKSRRRKLLQIFQKRIECTLPTESSVWGITEWGESKWGSTSLFKTMLNQLSVLDKRAGKKSKIANMQRDILIAETAILNRLKLLTCDKNLVLVTRLHGGNAENFDQ